YYLDCVMCARLYLTQHVLLAAGHKSYYAFFFFNATATTEIYTLSLHDALPILPSGIYIAVWEGALKNYGPNMGYDYGGRLMAARSEEHTSELQSRFDLVCRLLLEKKKPADPGTSWDESCLPPQTTLRRRWLLTS